MAGYRELARSHGLWLSLGGFHEAGAPGREPPPLGWSAAGAAAGADGAASAAADGAAAETSAISGRVYNTHVVLDSAGRTAATYRKIHLFDVEVRTARTQFYPATYYSWRETHIRIRAVAGCSSWLRSLAQAHPARRAPPPAQVAGGPVFRESGYTAPGPAAAVVLDSPIGLLGLTTCYDLRFPELFTALARSGAQVLLVPSAFTVPTGAAHWHLLLRARAVENQA